MKERIDGRFWDELRPITITRDFIKPAEGSALITVGETKVICTASIEEKVPPFLKVTNKGWVTAEYSMIPRATQQRTIREATRGRVGGRTMEIQRLIGRSLRAVVDQLLLGERTIWLDCDVIQADGGTRTAAITGSFIALVDACQHLVDAKVIERLPINDYLAAVSAGKIGQELWLDLCYKEDSQAEVDMNVVITGKGQLIEIQGTAEGNPFSRQELDRLLSLAETGIEQLIEIQKEVLGEMASQIGK